MRKLLVLSFINFIACTVHLHGISLGEYIRQKGQPLERVGTVFLNNSNLTDLIGLELLNYGRPEAIYTLLLSDNQLKTLPAPLLHYLPKLNGLFLRNNQLETLPINVFDGLEHLTMLDLRGNPFNPDFIPVLITMIQRIPRLSFLNGLEKEKALREPPFSIPPLKQLALRYIAKNIEIYYPRLEELPHELQDELLALCPEYKPTRRCALV